MFKDYKGPLILLMTSFIWGLAFVFQSVGMDYIGPFLFNALRFFIGAFILIIVKIISFIKEKKHNKEAKFITKKTLIAGLICGVFILLGCSFQQVGIVTTDAGKSGFITALYILFVPLLGLLFKKKTSWNCWVSIGIALIGFIFLCLVGNFSKIAIGDIYLLICSILFACQILTVDKFINDCDPIMISCLQFIIAGIGSIIISACFEEWSLSSILDAKWAVLYTGVLSCGVGYTTQMVGQKFTKPSVASLLLSLESVFALLTGLAFLQETLTWYEGVGCIFIFIAIIFSQITFEKKEKDEEKTNENQEI